MSVVSWAKSSTLIGATEERLQQWNCKSVTNRIRLTPSANMQLWRKLIANSRKRPQWLGKTIKVFQCLLNPNDWWWWWFNAPTAKDSEMYCWCLLKESPALLLIHITPRFEVEKLEIVNLHNPILRPNLWNVSSGIILAENTSTKGGFNKSYSNLFRWFTPPPNKMNLSCLVELTRT